MSSLNRLAIPIAFVLVWATGFMVARAVRPFIEPMTFLTLRFGGTAGVLAGAAFAVGAPWPNSVRQWRTTIGIGLLIQGISIGGVFWAVSRGMPAGVSALIASIQPLLTACVAGPLLRETVSGLRWTGILTGFVGVALVLGPRLGGADSYPVPALAASLASVAGMTVGSIWQKRFGVAVDLRTATAVHFGASALLVAVLAAATETRTVHSDPALWLALAWSIFGLSIGAVGLLLVMIRRGALVAVSAWMFLVPPVASLMSFILFDEHLTSVQVAGMVVATAGVGLAARSRH